MSIDEMAEIFNRKFKETIQTINLEMNYSKKEVKKKEAEKIKLLRNMNWKDLGMNVLLSLIFLIKVKYLKPSLKMISLRKRAI